MADKKLLLIFWALVIGSIVACEPSHTVVQPPSVPLSTSEKLKELLQKPENINFNHIQSLVLKSHCVSCHNPSKRRGNVDLTSYENLISGLGFKKVVVPFDTKASSLFDTLISSGVRHMPPFKEPQLIAEQKDLIHAWISRGAKRLSSSIVQRPPSLKETLQPYFDKPETIDHKVIDEHVFKNHCFKCHSSESPLAEDEVLLFSADLTSYQTLFNSFEPVVVKGQPEKSLIHRSVAIQQTMPPVKAGYDPLDSFLVKLMRLWILNCAIETYDSEEMGLVSNPNSPEKVRFCDNQ